MKTLTLELLGENEQPVFGGTRKHSQMFAQAPRNKSGGGLFGFGGGAGGGMFGGAPAFAAPLPVAPLFPAAVPVGGVKKPHRFRPGSTSLREIKKKKAEARSADKAKRGRAKAIRKKDGAL